MRENEKLITVASVPPPSTVGAPKIFADDTNIIIGYESFDASSEMTAILMFNPVMAHSLGPPNDETLSSHRLAALGLESYSVREVIASSWIHALEESGALGANWQGQRQAYRHFVITFHDGVFECIAGEVTLLAHSAQPLMKAFWNAIGQV